MNWAFHPRSDLGLQNRHQFLRFLLPSMCNSCFQIPSTYLLLKTTTLDLCLRLLSALFIQFSFCLVLLFFMGFKTTSGYLLAHLNFQLKSSSIYRSFTLSKTAIFAFHFIKSFSQLDSSSHLNFSSWLYKLLCYFTDYHRLPFSFWFAFERCQVKTFLYS